MIISCIEIASTDTAHLDFARWGVTEDLVADTVPQRFPLLIGFGPGTISVDTGSGTSEAITRALPKFPDFNFISGSGAARALEIALPTAWVRARGAATYAPRSARLLTGRLRVMRAEYPAMSAQFDDAIMFAKSFDDTLVQPDIWTDNETEVVLEWLLDGKRHAFVSFEGDGEFGYALRIGDRFVPGRYSGLKPFHLPPDLLSYLSAK